MKRVLVIGAGRGIGKAVVNRFGADGYRVAAASRTLEEVQEVVSPLGERGLAVRCDIADPESVETCVRTVAASWGGIDILVNSAGISLSAPLHKTTLEDWDRMMNINLRGAFLITRAVLPAMLTQGWGRVVHVASIAGKSGMQYVAGYCATKHGMMGMVKAAALEVAQRGVTVNAVCPGYVDSPMTDGNVARLAERTGRPAAEIRGKMEHFSPQGRLFQGDEIAETIRYLCSDGAVGINGQGINICGGSVFS